MARNSAVVLIGPRQAGKTTSVLVIAAGQQALYLDLESPRDLAKISDIDGVEVVSKRTLMDELTG
ncbi:AAA family ATPase [Myxococcota bacterium]|nr:AAA family ATPase [Myxococcota bacterium]